MFCAYVSLVTLQINSLLSLAVSYYASLLLSSGQWWMVQVDGELGKLGRTNNTSECLFAPDFSWH